MIAPAGALPLVAALAGNMKGSPMAFTYLFPETPDLEDVGTCVSAVQDAMAAAPLSLAAAQDLQQRGESTPDCDPSARRAFLLGDAPAIHAAAVAARGYVVGLLGPVRANVYNALPSTASAQDLVDFAQYSAWCDALENVLRVLGDIAVEVRGDSTLPAGIVATRAALIEASRLSADAASILESANFIGNPATNLASLEALIASGSYSELQNFALTGPSA